MPKYGNFVYGGGKYGNLPKLTYSVEPMSLIVLDFERTQVTWQVPSGDFTRIRLVRSQYGFPETAEDGVIVWEEFATEGNVSRSTIIDPDESVEENIISLVSGSPVYYRMFLYVENVNYWVVAGQITDVVPSDHQVQKKMFDVIPKVFVSQEQSPLGVVDPTSDIYVFLDAFSFSLEQLLTYIDLLRPSITSEKTPFPILSNELLNYGFIPDNPLPVKNRKRLVREAIYLYANKGLETGLETYIESLTGYAPDITVSPNLMLTVQDSTFYNSIGNWQTTNTVLTSTTEQVPSTSDLTIDKTYTGKAVASSSARISLGEDDPIRKGIPVKADTDYTFGYKHKSPTSAGNVTLTVKFYDKNGTNLNDDSVGTANASNNTWQTSWVTTTTPEDAVYASLRVNFSAAGTYYLDQFYAEDGENLDNTSYQEARAVNVFLNPNKTNYIKNPSFEVNTNEWVITATANSLDSDVFENVNAGDNSLSLDITTGATLATTSDELPILDKYYTLSFYAKASDTVDLTATLTAEDDGTPIPDYEVEETFTLTTDWQRFSLTLYVDSNDVTTSLEMITNISIDTLSGETAWVDAFQLEHSFRPSDYGDGNASAQLGIVWEGTANESYSHTYFNKNLKVQRLTQTLSKWLPANSFWRVLTYDGLEDDNLSV